MGLIAHQLERAGIPTVSISSARDITEAAATPRAAFLDFPLGHTTGKPGDLDLSYDIVSKALSLIERATGVHLEDLPHKWGDSDDWKDEVFPAGGPREIENQDIVDDRLERWEVPQYQSTNDAEAAIETHDGMECAICSGIDF
ncbi:MAG: hypothetical protein P8L22_00955 [Acidimicrobiales bacterium]|nr:hypothetical protein [Acidimicrobiales bacterium]